MALNHLDPPLFAFLQLCGGPTSHIVEINEEALLEAYFDPVLGSALDLTQ